MVGNLSPFSFFVELVCEVVLSLFRWLLLECSWKGDKMEGIEMRESKDKEEGSGKVTAPSASCRRPLLSWLSCPIWVGQGT